MADRSIPCVSCFAPCCYIYQVIVTGFDARRISDSLHLPWKEFISLVVEPETTPAGFRLDDSGKTYDLMLAKVKTEVLPPNVPAELVPPEKLERRCTFLIPLANGLGRCGIYNYRPSVCRTYPVRLQMGTPRVGPDKLPCPPNGWHHALMDLPVWEQRAVQLRMETALYQFVVASWNAQMKAGGGIEMELMERVGQYCAYVHTACERIDELCDRMAPEQLAAIRQYWMEDGVQDIAKLPAIKQCLECHSLDLLATAPVPTDAWTTFIYAVAEIVLTSCRDIWEASSPDMLAEDM